MQDSNAATNINVFYRYSSRSFTKPLVTAKSLVPKEGASGFSASQCRLKKTPTMREFNGESISVGSRTDESEIRIYERLRILHTMIPRHMVYVAINARRRVLARARGIWVQKGSGHYLSIYPGWTAAVLSQLCWALPGHIIMMKRAFTSLG